MESTEENVEQLNQHANEDECKIFVSRIPSNFQEDTVKRLLEEELGEESVVEVALAYPQDSQEEAGEDDAKQDTTETDGARRTKERADDSDKQQHRGFAFVTLSSPELYEKALEKGTIRGGVKATSTRKHTLYLRPVVREDEQEKQTCFLWSAFRCPYGDNCKFAHEGKGGCLPVNEESKKKKKKKCFAFKKNKCKLGDACQFSHEIAPKKPELPQPRPDSEKDCINWKTKGKCRKGEKCPYRHDESLRKKALKKKQRAQEKERQPLSIRVFGLNYDTTEEDVREYFQHCGPIVELTFPTFEDSGRSKGYCGILFQSPKAVAKAVAELDGQELHGRWLSVQAGKMYLKKWDEHHESRKRDSETSEKDALPAVGEFGQRVKKRRKHGYEREDA